MMVKTESPAGDVPSAPLSSPMFLTVGDVAREMQLSEDHVRRLDKLELLPRPIDFGLIGEKTKRQQLRWARMEFEAWIAAGCESRDEWESRKAALRDVPAKGARLR